MRNRKAQPRRSALAARAVLSFALVLGMSLPAPPAYASEQPQAQQYADGGNDAPGAAANQEAPSSQELEQGTSLEAEKVDNVPSDSMEEFSAPLAGQAQSEEEEEAALAQPEAANTVEDVVASMTLDQKISQMIIVAFRAYDGKNVTSLSEFSALKDALQRHQYGGVILYGQNISSTAQTAQLVYDLQANNASSTAASTHIPYLTTVDEEGGRVIRFLTGTRMTGSMAVGATGTNAQANALATGRVLGQECAALGFNVDFAPDVDVNVNPLNPVIGTRSFSDDPALVASLGTAFAAGLAESGVVATYKHFPGHGDTGTDTHLGTAAVHKTLDELRACELVPFKEAVANGADLIMTAHITLPEYDDEQELADGSKGYYPATMSSKIITNLLRGELGYDGVVVTDALEMGAIENKLVPGAAGSAENRANIAEKCINAGVDVLLLPTDMTSASALTFYDDYIGTLVAKVTDGTIPQSRIDESVTRILRLKQKYGIFDPATSDPSFELNVEAATATVGSEEHHATEKAIAQEAITLLKNDGYTLPLSGHQNNVVIVSRMSTENHLIAAALEELKSEGALAEDACINNLATGETSGSANSDMKVTLDYYLNTSTTPTSLHYTNGLKDAVSKANVVVGLTENTGIAALQPTSVQYLGESRLLADAHKAGAKFVMLSNNLPYDVARYQDSDAILLSYMASGYAYDPTQRELGNIAAYNANLMAAIQALFDGEPPQGTLPVAIPQVKEAADGTVSYDVGNTLYERGFGMKYAYAFLEGEGGTHQLGTTDGLSFKNNARADRLRSVLVDGEAIELKDITVAAGSTNILLPASVLNTLGVGKHTLTATYDYASPAGATEVSTTFNITAAAESDPKDTDDKTNSNGSGANDAKDKGDKTGAGGSGANDAKDKGAAPARSSRAATPKTADPTTRLGGAVAACAAALVAAGAIGRTRRNTR